MPICVVISSYVAASRVGGGGAAFVLPPLGVDPILIPTTLMGRHPGWGAPGGGAVAAEMFAGVLEGVEAHGVFALCDAVLTGYFASPDQVEAAASAIDRIKAADRNFKGRRAERPDPLIVVDPVMGDGATGLYVSEETADAIAEHLVPRADLITPNVWELARLTGHLLDTVATPDGALNVVRDLGIAALVSSLSTDKGVGVVWAHGDQAHLAETPFLTGDIPKGTGDLLALSFVGRTLTGAKPERALSQAVGATAAIIERAISRKLPELPLARSADLITSPPEVDLRALDL